MSSVEVLAPLRLETRFIAPAQRTDGSNQWMLRLRVYPDDFSMRRTVAPATSTELDRLAEAVARLTPVTASSEADAFASFAAAVGAGRALRLWRTHVKGNAGGGFILDRTGEAPAVPFAVHGPAGLPEQLEVWLVHKDGTRQLAATLKLDLASIGDDLDLGLFNVPATLAAGTLPETWWLSYPRAVKVGLGADLDVGVNPPVLDALVVLGIGDSDAADLIDAHNAGGRMAVLAPGTPTNTIAGEPTADFGDRAEAIAPLLHTDAASQQSTLSVLTGLTGRVGPGALPMLGGDLDAYGPGSIAVQGLWPVLWGRMLRDITGAGNIEIALAHWAIRHLAVEGPRPAFRVGEQPYGILPTSAFAAWVDTAGDPLADVERRIRRWALPWRSSAAAAARVAKGRTSGVDVNGYLEVLGQHAPSRHWRARVVADRYQLQALRALSGLPPLDTSWDDNTARALRNLPSPLAPIGPAPGEGPIPGPPLDEMEEAELLRSLPTMEPEPLFGRAQLKLGLVGHLMREALICARALVGDAVLRLRAGTPIELGQDLPWQDETAYRQLFFNGTNIAVDELRNGADPNGRVVARRFNEVQEALQVLADLWSSMAKQLFRAVLAALDTAAFRVDPWLTGIAERRLQQMIEAGSAFRLGAYGWVDGPAPFDALVGTALAPGPTQAGLLHAPSSEQALTAALLRDAAVRYPGSDRWKLTLNSAKVRSAIALSERVRLGVHPYEALGLEVERLVADWDTVRALRKNYALADDQQERRVCDGHKVLKAARTGQLAAAGFPSDLAKKLAPLDDVLDTYADLLVTDGVYALVTGRSDLANAAMEAAAGLGAPPELRAIRTPRQATTVRVSAWVMLPAGSVSGGANADPAVLADPAFAAAVAADLGPGALNATDQATRAGRERLAQAVGGADDEAPLPSLSGGIYEGLSGSANVELQSAVASDLAARLGQLVALAQSATASLGALDPNAALAETQIATWAARWSVNLDRLISADPTLAGPTTAERLAALASALTERLKAAAAVPTGGGPGAGEAVIGGLRRAIRKLAGRPDLPVIPIVARARLPVFRRRADLDSAWLEIVAAVRPRLAALEARQLDPTLPSWTGAVAAPGSSMDPWHSTGPVVVAYGPGVNDGRSRVGIAALDGWSDSVPSRQHATVGAFGFNAPKSRAPQAVLVAVPPDVTKRLDNATLLDLVLETRELVQARAPRQIPENTLPHPTSTAFVSASGPRNFFQGWPS